MSPTYLKTQRAKRLARSLKGVAARARIRPDRAGERSESSASRVSHD